jgi:phosphoglucosamine mutase
MNRRLFGTDGVRGPVGSMLTEDLACALGRAAITEGISSGNRVLVVRDTRESGPMLEIAFAEGASAAGAEVHLGGVLPTPAAPLLIGKGEYDLAAVISASHNPYEDNGIKLFGARGFKLADADEAKIETAVLEGAVLPEDAAPGTVSARAGLADRYVDALNQHFSSLSLSGKRFAIDCANGATFEVAPSIFRALGAEITVLGAQPDGQNINAGCGSTHPGPLIAEVTAGRYDAGFAFDGDGDRLIAVDGAGSVIDGDELIALIAVALKRRDSLTGDGIAVTVMSNFGLQRAMAAAGIEVATTAVGDRNVLVELRERGWRIGGEQSGHIIDMSFVPSGDGIASALLVLESLQGEALGSRTIVNRLPQVLVNVAVADREAVMADAAVSEAIKQANAQLEGDGRVLVRASGTEELVRVMVEAPTEPQAERVCDSLVQTVRGRHGI